MGVPLKCLFLLARVTWTYPVWSRGISLRKITTRRNHQELIPNLMGKLPIIYGEDALFILGYHEKSPLEKKYPFKEKKFFLKKKLEVKGRNILKTEEFFLE